MDRLVSTYFCIFCDHLSLGSMTEAYNHYKKHTSRVYYCPKCDRDQQCDKDHSEEANVSPQSESEEGLIEMWVERFLAFQSEIVGKTFGEFFKATKLFSGCVVCETFIKVCTNNRIELNNKCIQWSSNQSASNDSRHVCSHLRYYPFECLKCEIAGKYHKKCDLSEITRHIRGSHSMSLKNPNFEASIKTVKIRKLESLIDITLNSGKEGLPSTPVATKPKLPPQPISPVRSSKRIMNKTPKLVPTIEEPVVKRPKVETKIIVSKTDHKKGQLDAIVQKSPTYLAKTRIDNKNGIIMNIRRQKPVTPSPTNQKVIISRPNILTRKSTGSVVARPEIVFKPIAKTYSNSTNQLNRVRQNINKLLSGDQIIIKAVTDRPRPPLLSSKPVSIIKKPIKVPRCPPPLTRKPQTETPTLSQQFSDMMNDQEPKELTLQPTRSNLVQDMTYFCIFCPDKLSGKDEAFRHIQKHVEYLPIVCLTCGEGLTDLQSFMKHHRGLHREVVKGKYKKKEQPLLEKWISSFLYSQATIIRSFPPRESCPVCDVIFTRNEVQKNRPRRCTVNRKIDHVYRHMSYLPYECILCRQSNQEFLVAYFESKAHSHIKLKHPEIDDTEERWNVFQKTISIPKLDEFIDNYLGERGVSMSFERRPIKKNKQDSPESVGQTVPILLVPKSAVASLPENKFVDSSLNLNMIFSDIMETSEDSNGTKDVKDIQLDLKPIVLDSSEESEIINELNNDSNDSNMVVDVSPINLFGKTSSEEIDEGEQEEEEDEEEEMYFCVFCPENKYFTKMEAYSHYGSHLNYNPVMCKTCSQSFADTERLMAHHQSVHKSQDNVDYEIREDQILVKWVNEFLESQKSIKKVMPCSCSYNCPVCLKLIGSELSAISMPCAQHNDVAFSVHIHKHLNYFPYECLICKRNNKSVRVPNLDAMAMSHLKEHNMAYASMSQVVRSFPKTLVISQLEKMIGDSVNRKRISEKKTRNDPMNSLHPKAIPRIKIQPKTAPKTMQSSPSKSLIKTQHIRLQGGRVINLPPMLDSVATELAIGGSNETHNKSIVCINCGQNFANKNLFRVHHQKSHPTKPILFSTKNY